MRRTAAAALIFALLLGGCDYADPDRMAIITGAAVDMSEDGEYELSIEVIKTEGSSLDEPIETNTFTATAESLDLCEQELKRLCGAALYWGHAQALVLSEETARQRLEPLLDWVLRVGDLRLTVVIGVSGEEDAKTILEGEKSGSYTVGSALASAVKDSGFRSRGAGSSAHRTVESLSGSGAALLPEFRLAEQSEDREYSVVYGGAVMVGDRFAGFVDDRVARDLLLLLGADSDYELVRDSSGAYGLLLDGMTSERSASVDEAGNATVRLSLSGKCTLRYYDSGAPRPTEKQIEKLMDEAALLLRQRVEDAVEKSRKLGADTAGLNAALEPIVGEEAAVGAALRCGVEVTAQLELEDVGLIARSPLKG